MKLLVSIIQFVAKLNSKIVQKKMLGVLSEIHSIQRLYHRSTTREVLNLNVMFVKWDEMEDEMLVRESRNGRQEAFGELVRRHRAKVYGYAQSITQEAFLAEDIVQEALVRAFLNLGSLVDSARFLPWLHRIVRNQAYTKLRSSSVTRERVASGLVRLGDEEAREENWHDLDYILYRLSRATPPVDDQRSNPEERLIRQELLDMISGMLHCLKPRERIVFESHFFDQLSPQEIARLFHLTDANVYQILSRSRKKVIQERVRVVVDDYVKSRKDMNNMKKVMLNPSEAMQQGYSWTSAATIMHKMITFTGREVSLPAIMGYSGHAFRINIIPEDVHIAGPTCFYFDRNLSQGMRNLGFETRVVVGIKPAMGPNANLTDPGQLTSAAKAKREIHQALPEALELIHRSLDRGLPVMTWDTFIPEFGMIYGYDDEQRLLTVHECGKDDAVPYEHLGRGILEDLFVLAIESQYEIDERSALRGALEMILDHYQGREEQCMNAIQGLSAYSVWIDAFRGGKIEPNGNAYNTVLLWDARRNAAAFLHEVAATWEGETPSDGHVRELSGTAAATYTQIAEQLQELHQMFPFPMGGEPNDPARAERSIQILQSVHALEVQAVATLEQMSEALQ
ncbi:RNA polymerase sigma factor [Paenibacillus terrigena]|uniref:RNA polymerase sigma factor n=1 Tax=Paenibacillus terrigena TaxID=369333 RepID=UPI000380C3C4|nr:RNA polymerase sigma factor [Paenibacillus terrigena]